jgi:hypothetical protein
MPGIRKMNPDHLKAAKHTLKGYNRHVSKLTPDIQNAKAWLSPKTPRNFGVE